VVDGETGYLVPFVPDPVTGFPVDPGQFAKDLGAKVTELLGDPEKCVRFGQAGRKRVEDVFSWTSVAAQTVQLYLKLVAGG
jgi:starch synthase